MDIEQQLEKNHKLADLILIEIKAIFVGAIAKLQTTPVQPTTEQNLPLVVIVVRKEKTREVLADTNDGKGAFYQHPSNLTFDNPITAIHHISSGDGCLKFETSDGVVGLHPAHSGNF